MPKYSKPARGSGRLEDVAAIEDHRAAHQRAHRLEVGAAELLPLGDDHERIGAFERRDRLARDELERARTSRCASAARVATGS